MPTSKFKTHAPSAITDTSRDCDYLRISALCVRECGMAAAITLAAFLQHAGRKKNFSSVRVWAGITGMPMRTTERHLAVLTKAGWLVNHGRKSSKRRTPNRQASSKALANNDWKMVLPRWALGIGLTPSALALLAVSFHRARGLSSSVSGLDGVDANCWTDDEFSFSLGWLADLTGLSPRSIRAGHAALRSRGLLNVDEAERSSVCLTPTLPGRTGERDDPIYILPVECSQVR